MTHASPPGRAGIAAAALAGLLALASLPADAGVPARAPARRAARPVAHAPAAPAIAPHALAVAAREAFDAGDPDKAAATLRQLRTRVPADGDLELELALADARAGRADSAWARLNSRLLATAYADTTAPPARLHIYLQKRETTWLDGRFDGWPWYVARARAEVALALGRWSDAAAAARVAVSAAPMLGREHLLLAVAAGRAGDAATARAEAARAAQLDPLLPEAHYLAGLWAWRDGNRAAARAAFEQAIARDSSLRSAAIALVRLSLPGARPDSLPVTFLTGARRAGMLTAIEGPKPEDTPRFDQLPVYVGRAPSYTVPDSLRGRMQLQKPLRVGVSVLVGERGNLVIVDLPFMTESLVPASLLHDLLADAARWSLQPAKRFGQPVAAWANVEVEIHP